MGPGEWGRADGAGRMGPGCLKVGPTLTVAPDLCGRDVPKYPWSAIPAARSSAPVLKIRLYVILSLLVFCAAMGPLAIIVTVSRGSAPLVATSTGYTDASGFAATIANDYLAVRPTSLPVAKGLDPTFSVPAPAADEQPVLPLPVLTVTPIGVRSGSVTDQLFEIHQFAVETAPLSDTPSLDATGAPVAAATPLYVLDVTIIFDDRGLPVLGATPSLAPWPQATSQPPPLDYTSVPNQVPISKLVQSRINDWAKAWATGNSSELKALTGDPSPSSNYEGLGNFTVASLPKVISSTARQNSDLDVRISVVLQRDGAQGFAAGNEYDLLIGNPISGNPTIQAWGPPGSAIQLVPYSNAINRRFATSSQETQP